MLYRNDKLFKDFLPSSADKLRVKAGRTMLACAAGGALANLAEAEESSERSGG